MTIDINELRRLAQAASRPLCIGEIEMTDLLKQLRLPGYDLGKEQAIQRAIAEIRRLTAEVERLNAKITVMEQQEPVGWVDGGELRALSNGNSVWLNPDDQGRMVPVYLAAAPEAKP